MEIPALMLDLRTDFYLPCKLIAEEHFLYDSIGADVKIMDISAGFI